MFDWGNIVECHTSGYTNFDAFNELFRECGYIGDENVYNLIGKYKLSSISSIEEFKRVYELMTMEFKFNKSFEEFINDIE